MKYILLIIALLLAFVLSGCSTSKQAETATPYKLPPQHEVMHREMMSEQYKFINSEKPIEDNRQ